MYLQITFSKQANTSKNCLSLYLGDRILHTDFVSNQIVPHYFGKHELLIISQFVQISHLPI